MDDETYAETPSELLAGYAQQIGIDPTGHKRGYLIGRLKVQTEDHRTVLALKKARQATQEHNVEQKAQQLQQAASSNRQKYLGFMMGGSK